MIIKVKKPGIVGSRRMAVHSAIDDVLIKEDLLHPEKEKVMVYFRGHEGSGILELHHDEIMSLFNSVQARLGLIKKSKSLKNR